MTSGNAPAWCRVEPTGSTVGSYAATEDGLRDGLEKAYRALAREAPPSTTGSGWSTRPTPYGAGR